MKATALVYLSKLPNVDSSELLIGLAKHFPYYYTALSSVSDKDAPTHNVLEQCVYSK
jgi:hypothetical protein